MVLYVIQFQFTPGFRTKDIDRDLEILLVTLDIGHGTGINIDLHALEQQLQGVILDELDHDIDRLGPEPGTNRFIIKYRVDHTASLVAASKTIQVKVKLLESYNDLT
jgi:hypothetical protein